MTDAEIRDAIEYNEAQGYCDHEIKLIQKTVGAAEDGVWGPETVTKVSNWQSGQGLTADGKVGPKTWAAIKASWELVPVPPPEDHLIHVGCGLAAYDQTFPGHTPEEAMQVAYDQALALGCKELRWWSSEWLIDEELSNGGNKGNEYSGPWLASQTPPAGVVFGAWIDDPVNDAKTETFANYLVRMGIQRAAIMINKSNTRPSNTPWALRWSRENIEAVAELYTSKGIQCVATTWPRPSKRQIDAMMRDMEWILPILGSNVFEVDTEGNWDDKFLEGFSSMQAAADYLASEMRRLVGEGGELELTTFTYHRENSKRAQLAPQMDRLLPQAYSVRHREKEKIDWDDPLGPGRHQRLAVGRAHQAAQAA